MGLLKFLLWTFVIFEFLNFWIIGFLNYWTLGFLNYWIWGVGGDAWKWLGYVAATQRRAVGAVMAKAWT